MRSIVNQEKIFISELPYVAVAGTLWSAGACSSMRKQVSALIDISMDRFAQVLIIDFWIEREP